MSEFSEQEFLKLMNLCKIACSEEERKKFTHSLSSVLSYVKLLQEIPTEGVPACNHVLETVHTVSREDEVKETLPRETFLSNAPSHVGGMIRVPPIIKFSHL